jgi:lipid-A-disaccharide synthase
MVGEATKETILIVAGEASGDLHGSQLVRELRALDQNLEFYGVGGGNMQAAGVRLSAHISDMAVVGFTEVLSKLKRIAAVYRLLKKQLTSTLPSLVILIDYPEFNLFFARALKKRNIPIAYYISPQIWAWRQGRVRKIARLITKMIVIFQFEKEFYDNAGVDVSFVGHPLLDMVRPRLSRSEALRQFNLKPHIPTIGLLPGSRLGEIRRHLPVFLGAVPLIAQRLDSVQFVVPCAPGINTAEIAAMCQGHEDSVRVVKDDIYDVMNVADFMLVASGTATVEAAIMGTPMAIVYQVSPFTYHLGRLLIKTQNVGMVNIIAERTIVPELIQHDFTPEAVATTATQYLRDPAALKAMKEELSIVRERLGDPGASRRAAQAVYNLLNQDQVHESIPSPFVLS